MKRSQIDEVFLGLDILRKYDKAKIQLGHDTIYAGPVLNRCTDTKMKKGDGKKLVDLGWKLRRGWGRWEYYIEKPFWAMPE